jgi:choline dehydrogenase-like flavoprotein
VGSGPSGGDFARIALARGQRVTLLDVGRERTANPHPDAELGRLKRELDDPATWFLGEDFGSFIPPSDEKVYYGFPPSKAYVFEGNGGFPWQSSGFAPLLSLAAGGLAEAWTGGSYAFNDEELEGWPISWDDLGPWYADVAREIGVVGADDDLSHHYPLHDGLLPPLELDPHAQDIATRYARKREQLIERYRVRLGYSRVAVLSQDRPGRSACGYLGRCLWGCPRGSLWVPSLLLDELRRHPDFEYLPDHMVERLLSNDAGEVHALEVTRSKSGATERVPVESVALAAGAIGSARILLRSLAAQGDDKPVMHGLMDNRQVLMPFVNLHQVAKPIPKKSYQYHQLALGLEGERAFDFVHVQLTTLTTALIHPLVQSLPLGLRGSLRTFRDLHSSLGMLVLSYADLPRPENTLQLDDEGRLQIHYEAAAQEPARIERSLSIFRRVLLRLGCIAPPYMTWRRQMGESVHYAGLVPMCEDGGTLTATPECASRDFPNVLLADGITFPTLPAKNLTFTLMANASRIADLHYA